MYLNGEKLPIKAFPDYVEMYLPDKSAPRIHEKFSDRWEVVITPSDGQFHQVAGTLTQELPIQRHLRNHVHVLMCAVLAGLHHLSCRM